MLYVSDIVREGNGILLQGDSSLQLGDFSKEERIELEFFIEKGLDIVKDFNKLSFEELMSKYNK